MPTRNLKCLSVRQPHAWAICVGEKTVENKSRPTKYRGLLLIHAGRNRGGVNSLVKKRGIDASVFTFGAIIGVTDLADVVAMSKSLESNPWASGPFCWILCNPRPFSTPIPCAGQLGLFYLPESLSMDVESQLRSGRSSTAKTSSRMREMIQPEPVQVCLARGKCYEDSQDTEGAIRNYTKAIDLEPGCDFAYLRRGICQLDSNLGQALADFDEAAKLMPDDPDPFFLRGVCQLELGEPQRAIVDFNKAARMDATDWEVFYYRAIASQELGDMTTARRDFRSAKALNPDAPPLPTKDEGRKKKRK